MNPETHLRIAGGLLLILAALHVFLPSALNWRDELARLTLVNRRIFQVHCLFILLTIVLMGMLSILYAGEILKGGGLSRAVLTGFVVFWGARLIVQLFVYDASLWRGNSPRTFVHVLFTAMWAYLVFVYSLALARVS